MEFSIKQAEKHKYKHNTTRENGQFTVNQQQDEY